MIFVFIQVLSFLSLGGACSTASVTVILIGAGEKHCDRYKLSATMALLSSFLSFASTFFNFRLLPSLFSHQSEFVSPVYSYFSFIVQGNVIKLQLGRKKNNIRIVSQCIHYIGFHRILDILNSHQFYSCTLDPLIFRF